MYPHVLLPPTIIVTLVVSFLLLLTPYSVLRICSSALNDSNGPNGQDHLEQEKRVRREIANSNERRRMQSINAGFDSLRILLPPMQDGEKMSKVGISYSPIAFL